MLDSFCFAEFVRKPKEVDQNEDYELDALPDSLIEGNHNCCNCPKIIKLLNSNEEMRRCKVRRVFRYHIPNKHHYPQKYAHHLLLLFYPFRSENELLGGTSHTYQGIFSENYVTEIVHNNRHKFEPYAELVDEAYENAKLVDNKDAYDQVENDETVTAS